MFGLGRKRVVLGSVIDCTRDKDRRPVMTGVSEHSEAEDSVIIKLIEKTLI